MIALVANIIVLLSQCLLNCLFEFIRRLETNERLAIYEKGRCTSDAEFLCFHSVSLDARNGFLAQHAFFEPSHVQMEFLAKAN